MKKGKSSFNSPKKRQIPSDGSENEDGKEKAQLKFSTPLLLIFCVAFICYTSTILRGNLKLF
jgi:hypothetical protein